MNNKIVGSAIALALGSTISFNTYAALASNAILSFTEGLCGGAICQYSSSGGLLNGPVSSGSYYGFDIAGNGVINAYERRSTAENEGVKLGVIQQASGSHTGFPDGTESPSIDAPFYYFGGTAMHETTSPITILSDDGAGHVTLDFSGWGMIWSGDSNVMDLGGHNTIFPTTGIAALTCSTDCSSGDTYILDYQSRITLTAFDGVLYGLHLEGVISTVPVPAAAWLFGSGLIGLAGVAQRRKQA